MELDTGYVDFVKQNLQQALVGSIYVILKHLPPMDGSDTAETAAKKLTDLCYKVSFTCVTCCSIYQGCREYGDSNGISMGMGWVWGL